MTNRAKKRIALLLAILVLGVGGLFIFKSVREAQRTALIEKRRDSGVAARAAGDHLTVVNDLGFALIAAPDAGVEIDPELWLDWIDSRRKVPEENGKHILAAIDGAKHAVKALPNDPRPLVALLDLYRIAGRVTERLDAADRLLQIDAANRDALFARALSLAELGRTADASAAVDALTAAHPDDVAARVLALQFMGRAGASAEEVRAYTAALAEQHPTSARFHLLDAEVRARTGDADGARAQAMKAAELTGDDPASVRELLLVFDQLAMNREAADILRARVEGAKPGDELLVIAAERAWKSGLVSDAASYLAAAAVAPAAASDNLLGWTAFVGSVAPEPTAEAGAAADELRRRTTPDAITWTACLDALAAMRKLDWAAARERLSNGLSNDAGDAIAAYLLAQCQINMGEPQRAIEILQQLVAREPRWVQASADLAGLLLTRGRVEEAFNAAVNAIESAPNQGLAAPIVSRTAAALVESGSATTAQRNAAIGFLEQCVRLAPDAGEFRALLARAYAAVGRNDDAKAAVKELLASGSQFSAESVRILAEVSRARGWGLEAALAQAAAERGARDPSALFAAATEALRAGRPQDGRKMLEDAVAERTGRERADYELRLGAYLDIINDPAAKDVLVRLAEQNPADATAQLALLQSRSAWTDQQAVSGAIARLRAIAGDSSAGWRVFEARRLLTFEPTEKNASHIEVSLLGEIIRSDPRAVVARELAAEASLLMGDRDSAIRYLTEALRAEPDAARLYPKLIELQHVKGETQAAADSLRRFAEIRTLSGPERRVRAQLAQSLGQYDLALADLRSLAPSDPEARVALGRLLLQRGQTSEAEAIFRDVAQSSGADATSLVAAADFYAATGRVDQGRALFDRIPDEPAGRRHGLLAGFLERHGLIAEAERLYTDAAKTAADPAQAWNELAQFHIRRRNYADAEQAVLAGLKASPDNAALKATAQAVKLVKGDTLDPAAGADVIASIAHGVDRQAVEKILAALAAHQKNPADRAGHLSRLEAIAREHRSFFPATQLYVQALAESGQTDRAIAAARAALAAAPADFRPARLVALTLADAGRPDEALVAAREWRSRTLDNPFEADVFLAQMALDAGRAAEALRTLEPHAPRIRAQADESPARLALWTAVLAAGGRADEAARIVTERVATDPGFAARALRIAPLLADSVAAQEWIVRLAPAASADAAASVALGQAWYDVGLRFRSQDALRAAVDALRAAVGHAEYGAFAAALAASALEQLDRPDEAEAMYRASLEKDPDQAPVLNNLAFLLARSEAGAKEAVQLASRAVALQPRVASFQDTLAFALLAAGRPADAERSWRDAIALAPSDASYQAGLARALLEQGKLPEARTAALRAESFLGAAPDPALRQQIDALKSEIDAKRTP